MERGHGQKSVKGRVSGNIWGGKRWGDFRSTLLLPMLIEISILLASTFPMNRFAIAGDLHVQVLR